MGKAPGPAPAADPARREHDEAIKRLEAEAKRLNDRIHAMYVDKLDGLVDTAVF